MSFMRYGWNVDPDHSTVEMRARLAADLAEIERTHMPFGRYGPERFPPRGMPLSRLPYEYLAYFARREFPRGRLGELMMIVYQLKCDGAEAVFAMQPLIRLKNPAPHK
jgi:uncharacterized protein (DUF3820 family)